MPLLLYNKTSKEMRCNKTVTSLLGTLQEDIDKLPTIISCTKK